MPHVKPSLSKARCQLVIQRGLSRTGQGVAGQGEAGRGRARRREASQGKTRQDKARTFCASPFAVPCQLHCAPALYLSNLRSRALRACALLLPVRPSLPITLRACALLLPVCPSLPITCALAFQDCVRLRSASPCPPFPTNYIARLRITSCRLHVASGKEKQTGVVKPAQSAGREQETERDRGRCRPHTPLRVWGRNTPLKPA